MTEVKEEIKVETDVRDLILDRLKEMERTLAWLERQTDIPYSTLYSTFVHKTMALSQERLELINEAMEENFKLN